MDRQEGSGIRLDRWGYKQKVGKAVLLACVFGSTSVGQQPARNPNPSAGPVASGVPGTPNTPDAQAQAAADAQTKAEITDLANKIEAATVRGDVAYVDQVTSPDFTMVHGSGWTQGAKVTAADDKAAYLKRVKDKEYLVHDIDPSSIHFEIHGDVVITYGRYISLYVPASSPGANGANRDRVPALTSIWFERVYQKQNGKWMYLSHRSVRVAASPGGIDPGAVTSITLNIQGNGFLQGSTVQYEGNGTGTGFDLPGGRRGARSAGAAARGDTQEGVVYTGGGIPDFNGGSGGGTIEPPTNNSPEAQEVLALERKIGDAVPAGDAAFWSSVTSDDFLMTHGNIWTRGGIPTLVDNKQSFLQRVKSKQYKAFITDPATQKIEMHGNVAVTSGRYVASLNGFDPSIAWFSCWYERVFEKRDGKWVYLSHRTVHDPARGPTRESLGTK